MMEMNRAYAHNRAYTHRYQGTSSESRSVALSFGVSLCAHLIVIGALIFVPEPRPRPRFSSGVVNVSLVSLPAKAPGPKAAGRPVAKPKQEVKKPPKAKISEITPPTKKPVAVPKKPEAAISLAPKPKKKSSLKKKTIDRSKVIDSAIKQVQKKVDESDASSVKEALNRLKKKVEETETAGPQSYETSSTTRGGSAITGTGEGIGAGSGSQTIEAIRIYQAEIQYQIQKNWAFSQQLAGDSSTLEAVLAIKIMRDGEIDEIWFDKKSGNSYLDESAYKAIVKSNPLPALPRDYIGSFYKIGLIFGPKGLK
ncbi:MAG: TonB C-terminal domain-containing protein [Desulfobacteraceae bacterium]|jgi:colicin import membrane protein